MTRFCDENGQQRYVSLGCFRIFVQRRGRLQGHFGIPYFGGRGIYEQGKSLPPRDSFSCLCNLSVKLSFERKTTEKSLI